MGIRDLFFTPKYDDAKLVRQIEVAITQDPRLSHVEDVNVMSDRGVIRLSGHVPQPAAKDRVEIVARQSVTAVGLKFDHMENELEVV